MFDARIITGDVVTQHRYSGEDPGTLVTKPSGVVCAISKTDTGLSSRGGHKGEQNAMAQVALNRQYAATVADVMRKAQVGAICR